MVAARAWTKKEEEWLLAHKDEPPEVLQKHLNRTWNAIRQRLGTLMRTQEEQMPVIQLPKYEKQIVLKPPAQTSPRSDDYAYFAISDVHIGYIDENGHCINDDIKEKLLNFRDSILHLIEHHEKVKHFRFLFLGDIIQGQENYAAQKDDAEPVSKQLTDAVAILYEWLVPFIDTLYAKGIQVDIYCVAGNHGKTSKYRSPVKDNFDLTIYNWLKEVLVSRYKGLNFYIKPDSILIQEGGKNLVIEHGDMVRGLSLASLHKRVVNLSGLYRTILDALIIGHWHTSGDLFVGNTRVIMNGTLQGETSFTAKTGILPQESWYYFSTKGGHFGFTYRIEYRKRAEGGGKKNE